MSGPSKQPNRDKGKHRATSTELAADSRRSRREAFDALLAQRAAVALECKEAERKERQILADIALLRDEVDNGGDLMSDFGALDAERDGESTFDRPETPEVDPNAEEEDEPNTEVNSDIELPSRKGCERCIRKRFPCVMENNENSKSTSCNMCRTAKTQCSFNPVSTTRVNKCKRSEAKSSECCSVKSSGAAAKKIVVVPHKRARLSRNTDDRPRFEALKRRVAALKGSPAPAPARQVRHAGAFRIEDTSKDSDEDNEDEDAAKKSDTGVAEPEVVVKSEESANDWPMNMGTTIPRWGSSVIVVHGSDLEDERNAEGEVDAEFGATEALQGASLIGLVLARVDTSQRAPSQSLPNIEQMTQDQAIVFRCERPPADAESIAMEEGINDMSGNDMSGTELSQYITLEPIQVVVHPCHRVRGERRVTSPGLDALAASSRMDISVSKLEVLRKSVHSLEMHES
ncbi:hypothetical protein C8R44DRAFT_876217 [Mycena epipterygia]|nr:hypothetical protein C8R44DRAFT_876217 [Mycena epipterygia]